MDKAEANQAVRKMIADAHADYKQFSIAAKGALSVVCACFPTSTCPDPLCEQRQTEATRYAILASAAANVALALSNVLSSARESSDAPPQE